MRHFIIIAVIVSGGLMLLAIVFAFSYGPGPHAQVQAMLGMYAERQLFVLRRPVEAELISRASRPELFTREMSAISYGDSPFYKTDSTLVSNTNKSGARPIPYPPDDVWCVRMKRNFDIELPRYIFIALHSDLYNADWLLHEPADGLQEARTIVSTIGCRL